MLLRRSGTSSYLSNRSFVLSPLRLITIREMWTWRQMLPTSIFLKPATSVSVLRLHARSLTNRSLALEKESVLRWLLPSTVEDDLDRLTKNCLDGSFDWLLRAPEFTALFQPDYVGSIASIQGPPG